MIWGKIIQPMLILLMILSVIVLPFKRGYVRL